MMGTISTADPTSVRSGQAPHASAQILALRPEVVPLHRPMENGADHRSLTGRFCAWRGESDRRYVTTVFPVDRQASDKGLPDFEAFVLIAVSRGMRGCASGRQILAVDPIERTADRRAFIASALARGATEWHVYFVAEDRMARAKVVADLRERHRPDLGVQCA